VISADGQKVAGLTYVNNELFVLRHPSKEEVQVYDTETFTHRRTVRVPGFSDVFLERKALTSCAVNNCLYACDCVNVFKVSLSTGVVINWEVECNSSGLSVNAAGHVVVTNTSNNKIREYTTYGELVCKIEVHESHVTELWHAVKLTDSRFVVSHHKPGQGSVSLFDEQGRITESYSVSAMSLKRPRQLAVNGTRDSLLVVDSGNNRIVSLDISLRGDLSTIIDSGLNDPWCIHFDTLRNRLYVGEWCGRRVLIFDNVKPTSKLN